MGSEIKVYWKIEVESDLFSKYHIKDHNKNSGKNRSEIGKMTRKCKNKQTNAMLPLFSLQLILPDHFGMAASQFEQI